VKTFLGNATLFNRLSGTWDPALIFQGLDDKNFTDFEKVWKPALDKRTAEFDDWNQKAEGNVQDSHWDWTGKAKAEARFDSFAIECDGMTQGLMLVDRRPHRARLREQYAELCYVEMIASAPWNRSRFSDKRKYKGAGLALMATAISLSVELELEGRIGLHSLEQAKDWYPWLGFTDCGFDEDKRMQYYELTEAAAKALIQTTEDRR
jgi:hypothetical protein